MHELVLRIKDPELCYVFAKNAAKQGRHELTLQAYRRAVDLRTAAYPTADAAEEAAARSIFAYEEALSYSRGKRTRATGTWQMVRRHGLLEAVAMRLRARDAKDMLPTLQEMGMEDCSFQAVARCFPEMFAEPA
jgi:predicted HAD superfamily Cof-like phosphohydrolase